MAHPVPAPSPLGYAGRPVEKTPPWHGLVVADVLFNNLSTGLFLVTALGDLARPDLFAQVTRIAYPLALAVLLADLVCLVLDLGDPLRFHHMLRVFKPHSPMSLGTWFLTAYSVPLAAVAVIELAGAVEWLPADSGTWNTVRMAFVIVGIPFAMGSVGYKGVLFSTSSQPGWREARWFGSYLFTSALMLGSTEALVVAEFATDQSAVGLLRTGCAVFLVVQLVPLALLFQELRPTLVHAYGASEMRRVTTAVLAGGVVFPLLLLVSKSGPLLAAAFLLTLLANYVTRRALVLLPHAIHARAGAH